MQTSMSYLTCGRYPSASCSVAFASFFPSSVVSSHTCRDQYSAKYSRRALCSSLEHFCSLWNSLLLYSFLKILVSLTCLNFDLCLLHLMRLPGLCGLSPPCAVAWKLPLAISWAVTELTLFLSLLLGIFHPTLWILPGFWVVERKRIALTFVTPSWLDIEALICKKFDKNLVVRNSEPVHKLAKLLSS